MADDNERPHSKTPSEEFPKKGFFETPQKAKQELNTYYNGMSGNLTEASIQMCYRLIGANWVVFGSVGKS